MQATGFVFGTDLLGEGCNAVLDNLQHRGGMGGVALCATYHDARDVLERLVHEPVEHEPVDDTQDLRSRLARTAALKKPGSRERQESREEQER